MFKCLQLALKQLGVYRTFEISFANDIALIETCKEFISRFRDTEKHKLLTSAFAGASSFTDLDEGVKSELKSKLKKVVSDPVMCSECPGWVVYAEKEAGEKVIPHMSKVKAP